MRARVVVGLVLVALVLGVCAAGRSPVSAAPGKLVLYVPVINIYTEKGFGNAEWKQAVMDKIVANWTIPKRLPKEGQKMVFICTVARDGRLTSARDVEYSGDKEWDQAAAAALKASMPFPPLPRSWKKDTLDVHVRFEIQPKQ